MFPKFRAAFTSHLGPISLANHALPVWSTEHRWKHSSCFYLIPNQQIRQKDIMYIRIYRMSYRDGMCTIKIYRNRLTKWLFELPIGSMYDIFTHIWLIFMVDGGKHTSPMEFYGFLNRHVSCRALPWRYLKEAVRAQPELRQAAGWASFGWKKTVNKRNWWNWISGH